VLAGFADDGFRVSFGHCTSLSNNLTFPHINPKPQKQNHAQIVVNQLTTFIFIHSDMVL
jgi:hypothetical protein